MQSVLDFILQLWDKHGPVSVCLAVLLGMIVVAFRWFRTDVARPVVANHLDLIKTLKVNSDRTTKAQEKIAEDLAQQTQLIKNVGCLQSNGVRRDAHP